MDRPDLQQLLDAGRVAGVRFRTERGRTTVCELELDSGFVIYADASAPPERFDPQLGRSIAQAKALSKLQLFELYFDLETERRNKCRTS